MSINEIFIQHAQQPGPDSNSAIHEVQKIPGRLEIKVLISMYLIKKVSQDVNLSQKRTREYEKEGFIKPEREPKTNIRAPIVQST